MSTDKNVAVIRALLIISAVVISFWSLLKDARVRLGANIAGVLLFAAGILGIFFLSGFYSDLIKPLDMLLVAEVGVIYSMTAMANLPQATKVKASKANKAAPSKKRAPQYIA